MSIRARRWKPRWRIPAGDFRHRRARLLCRQGQLNLAILNLFARLGAGFDIVSGGELQRALAAGGDPQKIVFSGVGKTADEMKQALAADILCFNVESALNWNG